MKLRYYLPLLFLFLMSAAHAQVVLFQLDKVTFEALYENPEAFHNLDWEAHPHWRFVDLESAKKHLQSDTLEAGNYMIASLKELQLELRFTVIGGFYPFIIKNAHQPYLAFADREGNLVADVVIMRSRKGKLRKHKNTPFFYIRARKYKHISLQNDPLAQQWSIQFENITPEESYDNSWQQDKNTGYVVTNRGDFRHNDTLKVKAYLLHEKNHPVNQPVKVTLHQKNSWNAPIASWIIPPKKPGVFLLETILSDSLPLNEAYYINFNIDKNRSNFYSTALSARFYLSDYEVQEAKIEMESPHRLEISGEEDLVCHIQLMDGASLPIANATVSVQAKPSLTYIIPGGKKQLSLPSILQMEELATDANGVATFTIAKNQLQFEHHVSVAILAQAWLPNGQKLERNLNFSIDPKLVNPLATPIFVRKGDSLNVFMSNGSQETLALTETFSSFSRKKDILLPITFLSNPNIQSYQWRLGEQEGFISNSIIQPIQFTQQDKKGAIEVRMQNPYGLYTCVSFTNGKSIAATFFTQHKDTVFSIPARIEQSTLIEWSYINGGELESKKQEMYLSNRTLTIQSNLTDTIFPGRTDSIEIQVANYIDNPISRVDLTVVGFKKNLKHKNIPKLQDFNSVDGVPIRNKSSRIDPKFSMNKTKRISISQTTVTKFSPSDTLLYNLFFNPDPNNYYFLPIEPENPGEVGIYPVSGNQFTLPIYVEFNNTVTYSRILNANYSIKFIPNTKKEITSNTIKVRMPDGWHRFLDVPIKKGHKTLFSFSVDEALPLKPLSDYEKSNILNHYLTVNAPVLIDFPEGYNGFADAKEIGPVTLGSLQNDKSIPLTLYSPDGDSMVTNLKTGYYYTTDFKNRILHSEKYHLSQFTFFEKPKTLPFTPRKTHHPSIPQQELINFFSPEPIKAIENQKSNLEFLQSSSCAASYKLYLPNGQLIQNNAFVYIWRKDKNGDYLPGFINARAQSPNSIKSQLPCDDSLKIIVIQDIRNVVDVYEGTFLLKSNTRNHLVLGWVEGFTKNGASQYITDIIETTHSFLQKLDSSTTNAAINQDTLSGIPQSKFSNSTPPTNYYRGLNSQIRGVVTEKATGLPVPFCSIILKTEDNTILTAVDTDFDGGYWLPAPIGSYTVEAVLMGYQGVSIMNVKVDINKPTILNIELNDDNTTLIEEIMIYSGSTKIIPRTGLKEQALEFNALSNTNRDINSITSQAAGVYAGNKPIFFVDGVKVRGDYSQNRSNTGNSKLKNGPIAYSEPIELEIEASGMRTEFSETAIWEPLLETDADGKASFAVKWPGDITTWETHVLAFHPKLFTGQATYFTRSFKALQAELYTPRFLIHGDSVTLRAQIQNFTNQDFQLLTKWHSSATGDTIRHSANVARYKDFELKTHATESDTLEAAFRLDLPNGYIDGEQRKIPMYPAGAVTHKGFGLVAWKDTVFALPVQDNATALQVQIDNKTKSILGEELHSLANYAHDCNEQMSARLYGLVLLRDEGSRWNRLMNERKTNKLLKDLTSNQLENGTWTWWGKLGNPNLYMTQKIYENLLPLENENKRAQVLLEKGRQHFEDWFALAKTSHDTLNMLLLGARMGISQFNFEQHLQQIPDTNLTQQLTKGLIRSILGTAKPEATPLAFADTTSTGCYEWSTAQHSDHWRQTSTASLIGLEWLLNTGANDETLVKTLQGILAQRNGRAFYNTTHSAHFSRLLIQLEKQLRYTNEPPQIKFRDSVITTFPFEWRGLPTENDSLFITSNNQYVLVGGYQEFWERHPKKANAGFTLSRQFLHNGKTSTTFNRSQQVVYDVQFSTTKTAEYLTLELPLPAGMTLEKEIYIKNASHVAYFRNRVVVYYERLPKGAYTLQLPLITRFSGVFQVNPARLGSMYWKHEENFTPLEVIGIE